MLNCWMKTGLIKHHIKKAENEKMGPTCDTEEDFMIRVLKQLLPVQHHFGLNKLLEPCDVWSRNLLIIYQTQLIPKYILLVQ